MTLFDYIVLFIIICSVVISTLRGLIKEILSLISWIVALVVANAFGATVANWLPDLIPGQLSRMIKASGLSLADRGLGGLFGLARGCVIVMAIVLVCGMTAIPQQGFWKDALLSPVAVSAVRTVMPFLPGSVTQHVKL